MHKFRHAASQRVFELTRILLHKEASRAPAAELADMYDELHHLWLDLNELERIEAEHEIVHRLVWKREHR